MTAATSTENLTLKQLCEEIGYSDRTVMRLLAEGKGPGIKTGNRYLIRREWVDKWKAGELGFWSIAIAGLRQVESIPEPEPIYVRRVS